MARKRSAPVALAAGRPSLVAVLDEDAQVEVLHAANADRVLAALSSSCKQLCRLARSRIPVKLQVTTPTHAGLVIQSYARGGPPFSACTELSVAAYTPASCLITVNVLNAAQQWTALAHVELVVQLSAERLQPNQTLDYCSSGILSALPALRRLRHLKLHVQEFGACSARQLGQLVQLTRLELYCTGSAAADAVPPDLAALAGMTSLVDLVLGEPAVQPAAGTAGPFCFPSSLTSLDIRDPEDQEGYAACIARCLTHLPGCPHLQELRLLYSYNQHASAHPSAVVRLLAQHNRQLRMLAINSTGRDDTVWDVEVPGLPEPGGPVDREWRPDASLAVLTGLQCLDGGQLLCVRHQEDWQHLAQLTALSKLACFEVIAAPPPQAGLTLSVLELERCLVQLGGHDLGRLLLACPCLQRASIWVWVAPAAAAASQATQRLSAHPSLQSVELEICSVWNHTWNGIGWRTAAAAQLAALAPVLGGVSSLTLKSWPTSSSSQPRAGLPDLSPCTALTELRFGFFHSFTGIVPEQEDILSMLAPLVHLGALRLTYAPRLNARVALVLQHMLPQLRQLSLWHCGSELPLAATADQQQHQQAALQGREEIVGKVKQLLRDGLELVAMGEG